MTVNGENYLEMLHKVVVPEIQTKPNFYELFFQQEGASPHYVLRVSVSSEVEMNRTWTDNINLFQTLQLYARLDIKHQIRFNKLD